MTDLLADFNAKLDLSIGQSARAQKASEQLQRTWLDARKAETPRRTRIHGRGTASAAGLITFTFDNRPTQGRFWHVRKLSVGGVTPSTVVAGRADFYVSATSLENKTLAEIGSSDWVDSATTLPLVGDFSPGELAVMGTGNEQLWVVISGGTNGVIYTCQGLVEDYMEVAAEPTFPI